MTSVLFPPVEVSGGRWLGLNPNTHYLLFKQASYLTGDGGWRG